jgi:DNA-binding XRE family transcriptional regulator
MRGLAKLTQETTAEMLGVSFRTYQYYESGKIYPRKPEIYKRVAELFDTDANLLISDDDRYVMGAAERGGSKSKREVQALVSEVGGLFAGGDLSDDDKDKVMKTINDLYWLAKENNKKYTPKKYLKGETEQQAEEAVNER